MKSMIENYINGNLADAKRQAKRFSIAKIETALRELYGYSETKANAVARYLKGRETFQAACDAS